MGKYGQRPNTPDVSFGRALLTAGWSDRATATVLVIVLVKWRVGVVSRPLVKSYIRITCRTGQLRSFPAKENAPKGAAVDGLTTYVFTSCDSYHTKQA